MCRAQSADPRRRRAPVETVKSIRPARPVTAAALVTAAAPPHPVQSRRLWHGAASAHHDATGASIASHRVASRRTTTRRCWSAGRRRRGNHSRRPVRRRRRRRLEPSREILSNTRQPARAHGRSRARRPAARPTAQQPNSQPPSTQSVEPSGNVASTCSMQRSVECLRPNLAVTCIRPRCQHATPLYPPVVSIISVGRYIPR